MTQPIPMGQAPVIKELIAVHNGDAAEAIYFNRPDKQVICLSCQLSCPVGCTFCASPDGNPAVNLTVADMIRQITVLTRHAQPGKPMLISFMGEGEPALNIKRIIEVIDHYDLLAHEGALDWPVKFAVSTSGVKPRAIHELAEYTMECKSPIKLQFSLHAPTDEGRGAIIPVSRPLVEIIDAVKVYRRTYRKNRVENAVDINYTLIGGQNDREIDMLKLVALFAGTGLHVKLSRYNEVEGLGLKRSKNAKLFLNHLKAAGISCEYHFTDGEDSAAACGQTRSNRKKRGTTP